MTIPNWFTNRRRAKPRRRLRILAIAALVAVSSGGALAHDFWIQPSSFWIAPGSATSLGILVGHGPARQRWVLRLNRVAALFSVGPGGRRTDHSGKLSQGTYARDAELDFPAPGLHVIAFENTATANSLPADRFNDYLREEGLRPAIEWRQRTGATGQPGREIYSRRAKALLQVGRPSPGRQAQATIPLGMTLEIVPSVNPYSPGTARALPVRVFYRGRPQPGALVKLTNLADDEKPVETHITDGAGRALFRLPRSGDWQFNVVWTRPVRGNPDADFDTVFSSLTFGFLQAAR